MVKRIATFIANKFFDKLHNNRAIHNLEIGESVMTVGAGRNTDMTNLRKPFVCQGVEIQVVSMTALGWIPVHGTEVKRVS